MSKVPEQFKDLPEHLKMGARVSSRLFTQLFPHIESIHHRRFIDDYRFAKSPQAQRTLHAAAVVLKDGRIFTATSRYSQHRYNRKIWHSRAVGQAMKKAFDNLEETAYTPRVDLDEFASYKELDRFLDDLLWQGKA